MAVNKRGGAPRAHKNRKAYQNMVRSHLQAGQVNDANGQWRQAGDFNAHLCGKNPRVR